MIVEKVGNRGVLFTFDELNVEPYNCITNVFVIVGLKNFLVCDTYLGPYYVKKIKDYLRSNYGNKSYVVFNSHSHWDHVWGNSEFQSSKIIAHESCKAIMHETSVQDLKLLESEFAKDVIEIVFPNLTFESELKLEEENILFFHSPGHSLDSSSCYDYVDKVLFVGDNIDDPIPSFMCWDNIVEYRETLKKYLSFDIEYLVQSHGSVMTSSVIESNIKYLDSLIENKSISFQDVTVEKKHKGNLAFLNRIHVNNSE